MLSRQVAPLRVSSDLLCCAVGTGHYHCLSKNTENASNELVCGTL